MPTELITRLQRHVQQVDSLAPSLEEILADWEITESPHIGEPPPGSVRVRRGFAVSVAAAVAVAVLVGLPLLLIASNEGSEPAESPSTSMPSSTTSSAVVPPMVDSWQRVGGDVMEPIGGLYDITIAGERLVAVGDDAGEDGRPDGVILVSDNGFTWALVAEDDEALTTGAVAMYAITEGGPGLVAVGGGCDDPDEPCPIRATAWASVDGTAWTRIPYDIEVFGASSLMEDVEVTEHGIVAVGRNEEVTDEALLIRPAVWISPDGIEWARTWEGEEMARGLPTSDPPDTGAFVLSPMQAITVGPDGTLIAVGTVVDDLGVGVAAVWISDDGQTWERVLHDPEVFASSTGMDLVMLDVAVGESGLVAVGSERDHHGAGLWWTGGERPAVWTSPHGIAWERVTLDDEAFGTTRSISTVASSATGFVAAGPSFADSGPVTIWASPDGTRWQAVASFKAGYALSVIEAGSAMAAAGGVRDALGASFVSRAAVWVGPPGT